MDHQKQIKLKPEQVHDFVKTAEQCNLDVDVFYNRIIVDAKSILGVLSLDLTQKLTVAYAEADANFEKALQKYCIA